MIGAKDMFRLLRNALFGIAVLGGAAILTIQDAEACSTCGCVYAHHGNVGTSCTTRDYIHEEHVSTREHITEEFTDWETFLRDYMWGEHLHPALMLMTEQLTTVAMQQMLMLGAMLDAKHQMEVERLFAEKIAEAHRDYHPDMGMCVFGTNVRSLASAERNGEFTAYVMSQRSIDRQAGNMKNVAARGSFSDHNSRMKLFADRYCQPTDDNAKLLDLCLGTDPALKNKDIDFVRTVEHSGTLEIDFSDGEPATDDETDVLALANNLYAHSLMVRPPAAAFRPRANQDELLDMRSVIAKRSVAEHSFNNYIGMKSMSSVVGGEQTGQYMKVLLKQMGVTEEEELTKMLGDRPSYSAQMEVLTKKIYEHPDFFVDLYEKPANTARKKVAMQAISLMQDFDTWNSYLRTEAMLSVILELEIVALQNDVQNRINRLRSN